VVSVGWHIAEAVSDEMWCGLVRER